MRIVPAVWALILCIALGGAVYLALSHLTAMHHSAAVMLAVLAGVGARYRIVPTRTGFRLGCLQIHCGRGARRGRRSW